MSPPTARARTERGWFLGFQLALLFAALMWMPFGARDAAGVSTVLPALRPAAPDVVHAVRGHVTATAPGAPPVERIAPVVVAVVALAVALPRLAAARRWSRPPATPAPRSIVHRIPQGRAPPLPA